MSRVEKVEAIAVFDTRAIGDARDAVATLFTRGSIFKDALPRTKERLAAAGLAARLHTAGRLRDVAWAPSGETELDAWVRTRVAALGVESGDDLALLSSSDFVAPELPYEVQELLDRDFPRTVTVGDATYEAEYDLARSSVLLKMVRGARREPPPLGYLPRFPGMKITVEAGRSMWVVRQGG